MLLSIKVKSTPGKWVLILSLLSGMTLLSAAGSAWAMTSKANREVTQSASTSGGVWVVRSDGAQSCGFKEGQTIEEVSAELKKNGITVLESKKGNDGKMHTMVCGASSGTVNGFLISEKDVPKALSLGFVHAPQGFAQK